MKKPIKITFFSGHSQLQMIIDQEEILKVSEFAEGGTHLIIEFKDGSIIESYGVTIHEFMSMLVSTI